jgi:hypothetical protein
MDEHSMGQRRGEVGEGKFPLAHLQGEDGAETEVGQDIPMICDCVEL